MITSIYNNQNIHFFTRMEKVIKTDDSETAIRLQMSHPSGEADNCKYIKFGTEYI